ncbi:hypothetical protein [Streptomyces sp. NPDC001787]|uniref:hypothetical protein n=1 Tax=Streptomyces sp. NPDC001787 TaxID=3154523 RepID=UPI0033321863
MATAARSKSPARRKPPARTRKTTPPPSTAPAVNAGTVVAVSSPEPEDDQSVASVADARDRATDIADLAQERAQGRVDRLLADAEVRAQGLLADAARRSAAVRTAADGHARQVMDEVAEEAGRRLREATADADTTRTTAVRDADEIREQARTDAREARTAARALAARHRADAARTGRAIERQAQEQARQIRDDAGREAQALLAAAAADADRVRAQAATTAAAAADQVRTQAEAAAERLLADARREADTVTTTATGEAGQVLADARRRADEVRAEAARVREDAGREQGTARQEAARLRRLAEDDVKRLRATAAEDADRTTRTARESADRLLAQARTKLDTDIEAAETALAQARAREEDAAVRQQTLDAQLAEADEQLRRATDRTEKRLARKRLRREARDERRSAKTTRKDEARDRRAERRSKKPSLSARLRDFVKVNSERLLVILPITAPMAVAWTGQAGFAGDILGWKAPWTILFAAAFELSTTFVGWMYHQARKDGDAGTLYRLSTWAFAIGAAVMNFWHASGETVPGTRVWDGKAKAFTEEITYWHGTPKAVAFATMSILGMVLWELYATLLHRRQLREDGKVAKARPSIGLIRWARYPRHAFTAWSLAITNSSLNTLNHAWFAADRELTQRRILRAARKGSPLPATYRVLPLNGSANPSQVPNLFVNLVRTDTPNPRTGEPLRALPALPPSPNANLSDANQGFGPDEPNPTPREPRTAREPAHEPAPRPVGANREPRPGGTANPATRSQLQREQVEQVLNLIAELGYDKVKLPLVQQRTGMTKTTAYHRLNDARAEHNRRVTA